MELTIEPHEHVLSVNVAGRIDGSNAEAFAESLRDAVERTDRALLLVFRDLQYIDHAGLDVVSVAARSLGDRNARLALCELSEPVLTLFRISGLDRLLPIYRSEADARVSLE
ncbi:MAG: STAS domain-containing protein [Defluviicoccus sp.]|nr:STAS domain-containing protein [Defluviicoccus sp.]